MRGYGGFFSRESHNSKPDSLNPNYASFADFCEWSDDIRRQDRESSLTCAVSQRIQAVIEFMIPQYRCAVAHTVHQGHHGFTVGGIGYQGTGEHITCIQKNV